MELRTFLSALFGGKMGVCLRFFFQAEDGIRDVAVTGVQTCALPISFSILVTSQIRIPPSRTSKSCRPGTFSNSLTDTCGFENIDRKSTRLNSSHGYISYAVFCLKKKKNIRQPHTCDSVLSICSNTSS